MSTLFDNNARSTLAAGISDVATTLSVATGQGSRFPVIAAPDIGYLTLKDASNNIEIVKVTTHTASATAFTIVRGQEGTTARAWLTGDIVSMRWTAAMAETTLNHPDDTSAAHIASAITFTPAGTIAATTVQAAIEELDATVIAASDLAAHLADTVDAHDATAISYAGGTGISATTVEAAIDELATEKANAADVGALATANTWTAGQRGEVTALSDGANIAVNLADSNNFSVTLAGNRTLSNPTNATAGQSGIIAVTQDATGSRTLAYGTNYKHAGGTDPVLTTTAAAVDLLSYYVVTATHIHISAVKDSK